MVMTILAIISVPVLGYAFWVDHKLKQKHAQLEEFLIEHTRLLEEEAELETVDTTYMSSYELALWEDKARDIIKRSKTLRRQMEEY